MSRRLETSGWAALQSWLASYEEKMRVLLLEAEDAGDWRLRDVRAGRELAARDALAHMAAIEAAS